MTCILLRTPDTDTLRHYEFSIRNGVAASEHDVPIVLLCDAPVISTCLADLFKTYSLMKFNFCRPKLVLRRVGGSGTFKVLALQPCRVTRPSNYPIYLRSKEFSDFSFRDKHHTLGLFVTFYQQSISGLLISSEVQSHSSECP